MTLSVEESPRLPALVHPDVVQTPTRPPPPEHRFGTRAVHSGAHLDPSTGAVIAPVREIPKKEEEKELTCICLDLPVDHLCANQRRKADWRV